MLSWFPIWIISITIACKKSSINKKSSANWYFYNNKTLINKALKKARSGRINWQKTLPTAFFECVYESGILESNIKDLKLEDVIVLLEKG
jgi:hypothetical protein